MDVKLQRLEQTITILQLINEVPELPSENCLDQYVERNGNGASRVLTAQKEKSIVESLAFLAATSDDPHKVAALCVEEAPNGQAMTIRMAVNHGDMEAVKKGFEKLARLLERVARESVSQQA